MQTETISEDRFDAISNAASHGSYTRADVTLLTPNLNETGLARDANYLVVESAYTVTIIRLDGQGRPVAILERV